MVGKGKVPCAFKHPLGFVCALVNGHKGRHVPLNRCAHTTFGTRCDLKRGHDGEHRYLTTVEPKPYTTDSLLAELGASGLVEEAVSAPGNGYDVIRVKPVGHKGSVNFGVHAELIALMLRGDEIFIVFPHDRLVEVLKAYMALRALGRK